MTSAAISAAIELGERRRNAKIKRLVDYKFIKKLANFNGCGCKLPQCTMCKEDVTAHLARVCQKYVQIRKLKWTVRRVPNKRWRNHAIYESHACYAEKPIAFKRE